MKKYINEYAIECPNCGENGYIVDVDEAEFNIDGTGHYFID